MALRHRQFPRGIEYHPEDLCQIPPAGVECQRSTNKIQSPAEKVPDEAALLAESDCPWHCFDPLSAIFVQINGDAGMGLDDHVCYRSVWVDDEIQIVPSIDATGSLQVPHKPCSLNCRHFDLVDRTHHSGLIRAQVVLGRRAVSI